MPRGVIAPGCESKTQQARVGGTILDGEVDSAVVSREADARRHWAQVHYTAKSERWNFPSLFHEFTCAATQTAAPAASCITERTGCAVEICWGFAAS